MDSMPGGMGYTGAQVRASMRAHIASCGRPSLCANGYSSRTGKMTGGGGGARLGMTNLDQRPTASGHESN